MSNVDMGVTPTVVPFQGSFNPSKIREVIAWVANADRELANFHYGVVEDLQVKHAALREAEELYLADEEDAARQAWDTASGLLHTVPNLTGAWIGEAPSWYDALQRVVTSLSEVNPVKSRHHSRSSDASQETLGAAEYSWRLIGDLECELSGIAQEVDRE